MLFTYGQGQFIEGEKKFEGEIVLSEHKVYLRNETEDWPQTYVPLEKIESVHLKGTEVYFHVRTSIHFDYVACFRGEKTKIEELVRDIVSYRGFKKSFWQKKWISDI